MLKIEQGCDCEIIQDSKTVEWMINNTSVRTFDSVTFEGYQRKVNERHVDKIVDYLKDKSFYLPTSIICASDEKVSDDTKLYIVDGQHRVEAFRKLKETNIESYNKIKDYEVSVVILEKPSMALEVETFITINKTSRKVDTSLAYVLRNKINRDKSKDSELMIARIEFLAVELAIKINSEDGFIWKNRIMLEGNPTKNTFETISLNAFVRSTKNFINYLTKYCTDVFSWDNEEELNEIIDKLEGIYTKIWNEIRNKWPYLFTDDNINRTVLQGNIGVSSITKYLMLRMKSSSMKYTLDDIGSFLAKCIKDINIDEDLWYKGEYFSRFSSESGSNLVAKFLLDSCEI